MKFSEFLSLYMTIVATKNIELIRGYTRQLDERVTRDKEFALEFVEPINITKIHQTLVENLGITPKAFMLKTRVPNPHMRAQMMSRAIKTAVERV